ncbi:hypothetical protein [Fibrobacter sp.]|uniref:hypothetical protein n=1 Tax=Fibrobacter sp. TaxID=35828 RepID=UPI00386864E7
MKKMKSTFERVMSDLKQKMAFEKEYAEFLQSEILLDVERKKKIAQISSNFRENLK